MNLSEYLRSLAYFQSLDSASLQRLSDQCLHYRFQPGETIFHEGDPAAGLWLVESGQVKIFKINPEGTEHILHLLGSGTTFNDIAAFDGGPNPANASALSAAAVWLMPGEAINSTLLGDPQMARTVIKLLAGRVRMLVHQIEDLALYSVTIRLARFLLKQAEDPTLRDVTRAAIAAHLATTPESVSRALRTLEESGAIQFDRHRIIITREDLLRTIAAL
jgi:CRP/FNR family transcriptional regulator